MARAARSPASWRRSRSSSEKSRGVRLPTCRTPRTRPSTIRGTPSRDLMPFSRRIGLRMSAWSTSGIVMGRRSAAMRPAKPRPSGDAHALFDFLLDALGGAGVQRLALEQEDRDGVDLHDVGDPLEQLLQQVFLREVGQRRVGHPLQRLQPARGTLGSHPGEALAAVEACLFDGEGGAVAGELEEVAVLVGEVAWGEAADVQDAEDAAFDDQGDAEQGLDALLAQDRVEDVGVVDVGDRDGAALGGDAAREAAAERGCARPVRLPPRCPWRRGRAARRPRAGGSRRCRSP